MTKLADSIFELRLQGMTYKQIQSELGCSKATISYYLGAGQKEKNLQRTRDMRSNKRKYIQDYKQSHPCVDCGENYPYWMKDFDHLRDKEFNISRFSRELVSLDAVKKEISKCDVVCANCHRNRTYLRSIKTGSAMMDISHYYEEQGIF
jgi:transposase